MGLYRRKDSNVWWMSFVFEGKQYKRSADSDDRKEAQRRLDFVKGKIAEKKWFPETVNDQKPEYAFSDLVEKYSAWAEPRHKGWKNVEVAIVRQLNMRFRECGLNTFTTHMIEQFQSDELARGLKPATINRAVTTLKSMLSKATVWEMMEETTLRRVRKARQLTGTTNRLRFLSLVECQALVNSCEPHLKPIVITALNTGLRKGNILGLQWDKHIDLRHGFILLDRTKNGERLETPINDTLRAALQGLTRRLDVPYVFFDSATGKPFKDVKKSFHTALKNAEVEKCTKCDYQKAKEKTKRNMEYCPHCNSELVTHKGITNFHFHDLRHTFASQLVMAGVDLTTIKELLGHKDIKMTLRYAHLAPAHKVEAVKKIGTLFDSKNENLVQVREKMVNYHVFRTVSKNADMSTLASH